MLEKIKKYQKHPYIEQLRDVRVVSLVGFGVIVLLVSWSTVSVIQTNYELQQQIARMEKENEVHKLENENQKLRNEYYKTDQYLELQARRLFGKAAPGETVVVVPKEIALSKVSQVAKDQNKYDTQEPHKPTYQKNFEAWMDFLFHRS